MFVNMLFHFSSYARNGPGVNENLLMKTCCWDDIINFILSSNSNLLLTDKVKDSTIHRGDRGSGPPWKITSYMGSIKK